MFVNNSLSLYLSATQCSIGMMGKVLQGGKNIMESMKNYWWIVELSCFCRTGVGIWSEQVPCKNTMWLEFFFCCTTTSWRVEENLPTYLLNHIGPYEGVGPLLYILQTANNSGTWGQRPGAFPKGDNRSHFNFAHKRRNASRGDQVRHVVVYESTNPLWIFQQRESSSSWRPPSSTPGSK